MDHKELYKSILSQLKPVLIGKVFLESDYHEELENIVKNFNTEMNWDFDFDRIYLKGYEENYLDLYNMGHIASLDLEYVEQDEETYIKIHDVFEG